jgi:hypothetical protein
MRNIVTPVQAGASGRPTELLLPEVRAFAGRTDR